MENLDKTRENMKHLKFAIIGFHPMKRTSGELLKTIPTLESRSPPGLPTLSARNSITYALRHPLPAAQELCFYVHCTLSPILFIAILTLSSRATCPHYQHQLN